MNNRPLRRSHLIAPFGVGAMVDFPGDEAMMTAGLDAWPRAHEDCPSGWKVFEERLQERLGVSHFRLPPEHRSEAQGDTPANAAIPLIRFPRWHYCPRCGQMQKLRIFHGATAPKCRSAKCRAELGDRKSPRLIPVRIVSVCEKGHIQDFPFMAWAHNGASVSDPENHLLTYKAGQSATLAGIRITCSCGSGQSLARAFNFDEDQGGALHSVGVDCAGAQPWLGRAEENGEKSCGQFLRVVQRGATNVYFPWTLSSIYLPLWGEEMDEGIVKALENPRVWEPLSTGLEDGRYISRDRTNMVASMWGLDPDRLHEAAQKKLEGEETRAEQEGEEEFRRSEFEAIRNERGDTGTDLLVEKQEIQDYSDWMSRFFKSVCLLRKLRETRVLAGFTRLRPPEEDEAVSSEEIQELGIEGNPGWLPALVVRGEGIFLEFSEEAIQEWQQSSEEVGRRAEQIRESFNRSREERGLEIRPVTSKYLLLHTFAHVLIRQLCFECGYGSASLRERLYCNVAPNSESMQGVLIYTAAGDSEGSLGGLVRQGEPGRLEASIDEALRVATWCSSDPICIESKGQGTDGANLAACHGCGLVPETSCEQGNRFLDRAMLVGRPDQREQGFFAGRVT